MTKFNISISMFIVVVVCNTTTLDYDDPVFMLLVLKLILILPPPPFLSSFPHFKIAFLDPNIQCHPVLIYSTYPHPKHPLFHVYVIKKLWKKSTWFFFIAIKKVENFFVPFFFVAPFYISWVCLCKILYLP